MVATSIKFMCGAGLVRLYYCDKCGQIHQSEEEARRCEKIHSMSRKSVKQMK
jgi:ATP sulfurylase